MIQTNNEYFAHDASLSQKRFEAIADFLTPGNIQEGDHIYVEPLHATASGVIPEVTFQGYPLQKFIHRVNGVKINEYLNYASFYEKFKNSEEYVKIVYFSQACFTGDVYIALITIKGNELTENWENICVDSIKIAYFAPNKQFGISVLSKYPTSVKIGNQQFRTLDNYNYANLYFRSLPIKCEFDIHGTQLYPMSLIITNLPYPNFEPLYIDEFPRLYKRMAVNAMIRRVKSSSEWMKLIEGKAIERGISLDDAVRGDAEWLIERGWKWHEGKTE